MRPRYLLIVGEPDIAEPVYRRCADTLTVRETVPGGTLLYAADCPVLAMPAIDGWIIGAVHGDIGGQFGASAQLAVMSSCGASLLHNLHGSYAAIWRGAGDGAWTVLRDPSAALPVLYAQRDRILLVSSDVEWLARSHLFALNLSPQAVARHLRFPFVPSRTTCISTIRELAPGQLLVADGESPETSRWSPEAFVDRDRGGAASLTDVIDRVVAEQLGGRTRVGIELSGGLDSSIVASSVVSSGCEAIGLHLVPTAADGDERRYAELVATMMGIELVPIAIGVEDFDPLARPSRLTPRPTHFAHLQPVDRKLQAAAKAAGVDRIFSGGGGDSVFCSIHATSPVIDAWRHRGLACARQAIEDLATIADVTKWSAWRHVAKRVLRDAIRSWSWTPDDRLLSTGWRPSAEAHPWRLPQLDPGTRSHVASILRIQGVLDGHDRIAWTDMRFPLLSQPVIEACLSIPSWEWIAGGRDRAPARLAFADRIPKAVLERRGKGQLDTLIVQAYEQARRGLRELLLDGWLSSNGIIDRVAVERALADPVRPGNRLYIRVLALADAELWAQSVLSRNGEAGAI
ncbi:asparagine synthase-related protein [Sphingomonas oryzagri]